MIMESKKYALLKDGFVKNIILWDGISEYIAEKDIEIISIHEFQYVDIGWEFSNGEWNPPENVSNDWVLPIINPNLS